MPATVKAPCDDVGVSSEERQRRARYLQAYAGFSRDLSSHDRARINGSASPSWDGKRTFSLPVNEEAPAFRSECPDGIAESLDELFEDFGPSILAAIAIWLQDRSALNLGRIMSIEQFYVALSRIKEAKNSRLESHLIELAMGRDLHSNSNGYRLARHFGLKPQTIHEMLADTCRALGVAKPLSKQNTSRYSKTQYRHHVEQPPTKS